ncbi:TetR/AcrR family transcriptional regulator [Amycolatopsis jiangsuensis]|uniref:AcrR family transcriptional regulator n=1 Tax=Amycolatopsis jiangsuensis TaxID=1181879 RepID=A0A840J156_9PSEU|nr:TetR/AcrR family transcriptional regulator [Amycolatopsis jiangsuensis]MBB4688726.1 AcrR family transcriptional regulator [Amycolatopsis jiangsuensis]
MTTPGPSLRADAARNRELLLAAAEEVFAEQGPDASIADIARRAGVAKGTVFRHFATKEELVAAIVGGHFAALIAVARGLLDSADPGAALREFLTVAADGLNQDLTALQTISEGDSRVTELRNQLHTSIEVLVERAREAGAVRPDLTGADVFLLICAPVHAAGFSPTPHPDLWRRYLGIIVDGLSPEGATALPHPAPEWP